MPRIGKETRVGSDVERIGNRRPWGVGTDAGEGLSLLRHAVKGTCDVLQDARRGKLQVRRPSVGSRQAKQAGQAEFLILTNRVGNVLLELVLGEGGHKLPAMRLLGR